MKKLINENLSNGCDNYWVEPKEGLHHSPPLHPRLILANQMRPVMPFPIDMFESEVDFKVVGDLPGVLLENIDVSIESTVEGNILVIKAERKMEHHEPMRCLERVYGSVLRQVLLPRNADIEQGATRLLNGVLTVTFPIKEVPAPKRRRLQVNA